MERRRRVLLRLPSRSCPELREAVSSRGAVATKWNLRGAVAHLKLGRAVEVS